MRNSGKNKLTSAVLILAVFALLQAGCSSKSAPQWGKSIEYGSKGTLYYASGVTEQEARKLADYLSKLKSAQGELRPFRLTKENGVYQVRAVTDREVFEKEVPADQMGPVDAARLLAEDISGEVFNGAKVEWHFCDKDFKTLRAVGY